MTRRTKPPNERLIGIAAELALGPNLDERFDLDDRLPRWAVANVERICDRQRELALAIRDCTDKLMTRMRRLEAVAEAAKPVAETFRPFYDEVEKPLVDALAALEADRSSRKPVSG